MLEIIFLERKILKFFRKWTLSITLYKEIILMTDDKLN